MIESRHFIWIALVGSLGCKSELEVQALSNAKNASAAFKVASINRIVAGAGQTLSIKGQGFLSSMQVRLSGLNLSAAEQTPTVTVLSPTQANVTLPKSASFGLLNLTASQNGVSQSLGIFSSGDKMDYPIITADAAMICKGTDYYDATGALQSGTTECRAALPDCAQDGATGCVTVSDYPAADIADLASKLTKGSTVAGIDGNVTLPAAANVRVTNGAYGVGGTGTAPTLHNCTADGTLGCVTVTGYPAVKLANVVPGNVQAGTQIGGVSGTLAACISDGQIGCITSSILPAAAVTGFSNWDLRAGRTLGGVVGALKTNCRNGVNSTFFNYDGAIAGLTDAAFLGGTANDQWDTVDDYYGIAPSLVAGWSADTNCDVSTWTDATTPDGGATGSTCAASPANCQYRDKITNQVVSGLIASGATWSVAIQNCTASTYGGFPAGTWRLPTQKELLTIAVNGIAAVASANYMSLPTMEGQFWSSTTTSTAITNAWNVMLAYAGTWNSYASPKSGGKNVLCVRP